MVLNVISWLGSFYKSIYFSRNECTRICSLLCRISQTAVSHNYRLLEAKLNTRYNLHETSKLVVTDLYKCDLQWQTNGDILRELCLSRDGILNMELSKNNIINLIDNICID